ncbi:TPA: transposase [Enterococcus faecium]
MKQKKVSNTDTNSGWFHKGEHKQVFAYNIQTACDQHGWILDYSVHPGNQHDSQAFNGVTRTSVQKIAVVRHEKTRNADLTAFLVFFFFP